MTAGDQCRLSKLNFVIYNQAIFLLNPSKRRTARVKFQHKSVTSIPSCICIILVQPSQSQAPFAGSRGLSASVYFLPLHHPLLIFALAPFFVQAKHRKPHSSLFASRKCLLHRLLGSPLGCQSSAIIHGLFYDICRQQTAEYHIPISIVESYQ